MIKAQPPISHVNISQSYLLSMFPIGVEQRTSRIALPWHAHSGTIVQIVLVRSKFGARRLPLPEAHSEARAVRRDHVQVNKGYLQHWCLQHTIHMLAPR